jgi:hypothetical protein
METIKDCYTTETRKGYKCDRTSQLTTGQQLNLTQYIENGYEDKHITGTAFVDLSGAYDTVNHKHHIRKMYKITDDIFITKCIRLLLACLGRFNDQI